MPTLRHPDHVAITEAKLLNLLKIRLNSAGSIGLDETAITDQLESQGFTRQQVSSAITRLISEQGAVRT